MAEWLKLKRRSTGKYETPDGEYIVVKEWGAWRIGTWNGEAWSLSEWEYPTKWEAVDALEEHIERVRVKRAQSIAQDALQRIGL